MLAVGTDTRYSTENGVFSSAVLHIRNTSMRKLQATHAVYRSGRLIFSGPGSVLRDGTEVVVTYLDDSAEGPKPSDDPLRSLRGRGKGEALVEKLLKSRREDRERE